VLERHEIECFFDNSIVVFGRLLRKGDEEVSRKGAKEDAKKIAEQPY